MPCGKLRFASDTLLLLLNSDAGRYRGLRFKPLMSDGIDELASIADITDCEPAIMGNARLEVAGGWGGSTVTVSGYSSEAPPIAGRARARVFCCILIVSETTDARGGTIVSRVAIELAPERNATDSCGGVGFKAGSTRARRFFRLTRLGARNL
jgi:hypothetical protein